MSYHRSLNFSVYHVTESVTESNMENNVLGHFVRYQNHIYIFLISIRDSKDNIAVDILKRVHFNKIHKKPFVKPRKRVKKALNSNIVFQSGTFLLVGHFVRNLKPG